MHCRLRKLRGRLLRQKTSCNDRWKGQAEGALSSSLTLMSGFRADGVEWSRALACGAGIAILFVVQALLLCLWSRTCAWLGFRRGADGADVTLWHVPWKMAGGPSRSVVEHLENRIQGKTIDQSTVWSRGPPRLVGGALESFIQGRSTIDQSTVLLPEDNRSINCLDLEDCGVQ